MVLNTFNTSSSIVNSIFIVVVYFFKNIKVFINKNLLCSSKYNIIKTFILYSV